MKRNRKFDSRKLLWLRLAKEFAVVALAAFLVFRFLLGVSFVSGHSMEPTLRDGQAVVYNRLQRQYSVGDIVSFRMPSGEYIIKRVVAVAGDTVDIRDGKLFVNGEEEQGDYWQGETLPQDESVEYPLTLREGQFFALGDNREVSVDSRTIGPVSESQSRGKIFLK